MTDELLFSTLGLAMDTSVERQLPTKMNLPYDYEVSCETPLSDDFGIIDGQSSLAANPTDCYTDLTYSTKSSWNDWSSTNTPTSSGTYIHIRVTDFRCTRKKYPRKIFVE